MEERNDGYESQKNDGMRNKPLKGAGGIDGSRVTKDPNPIMGLFYAIILGIVAAIFWAIIVQVTGYNLGIAAIAVGFIVSQGFVWAGKSDLALWGVTAAVIAALSIFLGKVLVMIIMVAEFYEVSFFEMVPLIDYSQLMAFIVETFELFDIVFYAIALQTAYKRSFNKTTVNYGDFMKPSGGAPHLDTNRKPSVSVSNDFDGTSAEYEESPERSKQPMATPESEAR